MIYECRLMIEKCNGKTMFLPELPKQKKNAIVTRKGIINNSIGAKDFFAGIEN